MRRYYEVILRVRGPIPLKDKRSVSELKQTLIDDMENPEGLRPGESIHVESIRILKPRRHG